MRSGALPDAVGPDLVRSTLDPASAAAHPGGGVHGAPGANAARAGRRCRPPADGREGPSTPSGPRARWRGR
ncbi:hypothetical protein CP968_03565 [Streptomyces subrutilus]|uniref:Uncharacterized protein n=1 Tax=Streptomyces subrutilus TaxID=36818 RepID=A0A5P2UDX3_9ACTN|nr:hypothetical protein CP968_03565 [Streptomyces subrutilus]